MAGNVLEFIIKAKDQASSVLAGIGEEGVEAGESISSKFLGIGAAATGMGAIMVGALDNSNVATGKLQAQLGLTKEEAEALGSVAKDVYTNNFGESIGEVTSVAGALNQTLGLTGDELKSATEDVFRVTDAFGDLGAEPALMTNSLKQLKAAFPDKSNAELLDMIAHQFQEGTGVAGDLLDTMTEYPQHFADIGLSARDMGNFLNEGLENGAFNTDILGDAVKEFGILVSEEGSSAQLQLANMFGDDQAAKLISNFNEGGEAGREAFFTMLEGLNKIEDPMKRNQAAVALFGSMGEDLGSSLFEMIPGFLATKDASEDLSGATESLDAQYAGLAGKIEGMKRKVMTNIVAPFSGVAEPALQAATAATGVGTALMGLDSIGINATGMLGKLGGVMKSVVSPTKIMTAAQAALNLVMSANPIVLVVLAIAALAAGLVIAYQKSETFRNIVNGAFGAIQGFVQPVIDWFMMTVVPFFAETLPAAFSALSGKMMAIWTAISSGATAAWTLIKTVVMTAVQGVAAVVMPIFHALQVGITAVWKAISTVITTEINIIKAIITTVFGALLPIVEPIWNAIQTVITTAIGAAKVVVETTLGALQAIWSTIWNAIKAIVEPIWSAIVGVVTSQINAAKAVVESVLGAIKGVWESVWGAIQGIAETVWDAISGVVETTIGTIQSTIESVTGTIQSVWESVWGTIQSVAETTWDAIQTKVETVIGAVESVIDTTTGAIKTIVETAFGAIQTKVEEVMGAVETAVDTKINAAKDAIDTAVDTAKGYVEDAFEAMRKAVSDKFDAVVTLAEGIGGRITTAIGDLSRLLWDVGTDVVQGLVDGLLSMKDVVDSAVETIAGWIPSGVKDVLGIFSPSKVLMRQGEFASMGLAIGIRNKAGDVSKAAIDVANRAVTAINTGLGMPTYSKVTFKQGRQAMIGLAKGMEDGGSEASAAAEAQIAKIQDQLNVQVNNMRTEAESKLQQLQQKLEMILVNINSNAAREMAEVRESIGTNMDLSGQKAQQKMQEIRQAADEQMAAARAAVQKEMVIVRKAMQENMDQASQNAEQKIAEIKASISDGTEAAADATAENSSDMEKSFTQSLDEMKQNALQRLGELQTIVSEALWGMKPDAIRAGLALGRGFIDGIQLTWPRLRQVGEATAQIVIDAIQSQLAIASPSRVTRGQGEMIGQGLVDGLRSMHGRVQREADRLGVAATPTIGTSRAGIRAPLATGLAAAGLTVTFNIQNLYARDEAEARRTASGFADSFVAELRKRGTI